MFICVNVCSASGKYGVKVYYFDASDAEGACVDINWTLKSPSPPRPMTISSLPINSCGAETSSLVTNLLAVGSILAYITCICCLLQSGKCLVYRMRILFH